ncbi:MAG: hypothetical protein Q9190_006137, partial [Brigantiaea leucoxantha]
MGCLEHERDPIMSPTSTFTLTHSPAASLQAPATQNTAPVLSFRCLYTYDFRRKAKRWQDGILRFHTFNKRIMVYDVPRNYIGDTHWREPQAIQDGDELELDKGVIIQVAEEMEKERTATDLTELLEKRRTSKLAALDGHDSGRAQDQTQVEATAEMNKTVRPIAAQGSQLRPKSLNSVLGTSKGRLGRAALPTKSPAEKRQEQRRESAATVDTPNKRPRLECPASERPVLGATGNSGNAQLQESSILKPKSDSLSSEGMVLSDQPDGLTVCVRRQPASAANKVAKVRINKQAQNFTKDVAATRSYKMKSRLAERATAGINDLDCHSTGQATGSNPRVGIASSPSAHQQEPPSADTAIIVDSDSECNRSQHASVQSTRLRIAARKPRKKLMYRDLLPQTAPPEDERLSAKKDENASTATLQKRDLTFEKVVRPKDPLTSFHQAQHDRLKTRLMKRVDNVSMLDQSHSNPPSLHKTNLENRLESISTDKDLEHLEDDSRNHPKPPDPSSPTHDDDSESLFLSQTHDFA